jgi:hypothetical protein
MVHIEGWRKRGNLLSGGISGPHIKESRRLSSKQGGADSSMHLKNALPSWILKETTVSTHHREL